MAVSEANVKNGLFYDLGSVPGKGAIGDKIYAFLDNQGTFICTRYYRLKMVDPDGTFEYSSIKAIIFDHATDWQGFPNPSKGLFWLEAKRNVSGPVHIEVLDQSGRVRRRLKRQDAASAMEIDLRAQDINSGVYIIMVTSNEGEKRLKVIKE